MSIKKSISLQLPSANTIIGHYDDPDGYNIPEMFRDVAQGILFRCKKEKNPDFLENIKPTRGINMCEMSMHRNNNGNVSCNLIQNLPDNVAEQFMIDYFNSNIWNQFQEMNIDISKQDAFGAFATVLMSQRISFWNVPFWKERAKKLIKSSRIV